MLFARVVGVYARAGIVCFVVCNRAVRRWVGMDGDRLASGRADGQAGGRAGAKVGWCVRE